MGAGSDQGEHPGARAGGHGVPTLCEYLAVELNRVGEALFLSLLANVLFGVEATREGHFSTEEGRRVSCCFRIKLNKACIVFLITTVKVYYLLIVFRRLLGADRERC